jgi:hypothetical protein
LVKAKDYESDWRNGRIKPDVERLKLKEILLKYRTGFKVSPYYQSIVDNIFAKPDTVESRTKRLKRLEHYAAEGLTEYDEEKPRNPGKVVVGQMMITYKVPGQPIKEELLYDQLLYTPAKWAEVFKPFDEKENTWCILSFQPSTYIARCEYLGDYRSDLREMKETVQEKYEDRVVFLIDCGKKISSGFDYNLLGYIEFSDNPRFRYVPKLIHIVSDSEYVATAKIWNEHMAKRTDCAPFILRDVMCIINAMCI